jgi:hypothetical protein
MPRGGGLKKFDGRCRSARLPFVVLKSARDPIGVKTGETTCA